MVNMIAVIQKAENGYIARYERHLQHSVEKVWAYLTENDKLIKWFSELEDHTPKDLAGWHVCLDVIKALLDGKTFESRNEEWKIQYELYKQLLDNFIKT
jgi:hypothetical protein